MAGTVESKMGSGGSGNDGTDHVLKVAVILLLGSSGGVLGLLYVVLPYGEGRNNTWSVLVLRGSMAVEERLLQRRRMEQMALISDDVVGVLGMTAGAERS
jgi:hypothetical protein